MEQNISQIHDGNHPFADALRAPAGERGEPGHDLFVINLCSSIAPMALAGKSVAGLEHCRLYQVARIEDGRTRHRLRLGFFPSEAAAEQALSLVRDNYPTAFTAALSLEDRKFTRGFAVTVAAPAPRPRPAISLVPNQPASPVTSQQISAPPPAAASTAQRSDTAQAQLPLASALPEKPRQAASPATTRPSAGQPNHVATPVTPQAPNTVVILESKPATLELSLASDPDPTPEPAPADTSATAPFHVGKGIAIPALPLNLDLVAEPPAQTKTPQDGAARNAVTAAAPRERADVIPLLPAKSQPAGAAAVPSASTHTAARSPAAVPPMPRPTHRPLPELDSTQTIRALTSAELNDDSGEKWFAIQLAVSEQAVNLEAMPHLDIFEAYRLYSVASAGSGKILHSLRVGFFSEQVSAEAVAGYLKTFFAAPAALRISTAEYLRFCNSPTQKPRPGTANPAKVIELGPVRDTPTIPTVTEVAAPAAPPANTRSGATGSHKALQLAAKSAVAAKRATAPSRFGTTGKFKAMPPKTLQQALIEEARATLQSQQEQSKSAKSDSLLSRLVGRLTK